MIPSLMLGFNFDHITCRWCLIDFFILISIWCILAIVSRLLQSFVVFSSMHSISDRELNVSIAWKTFLYVFLFLKILIQV